jgi:hypothetical protein
MRSLLLCAMLASVQTVICPVAEPEPSVAGGGAGGRANAMKSVFPIGVWYDGRVEGINCPKGYVDVPAGLDRAKAYYEKTFKDIKDHGIGIVVIPNTPPDYRETLLTAADSVGVKIVLEVAEVAWPQFGGDLSIQSPNMIVNEGVLHDRLKRVMMPVMKHPSVMGYQLVDEPPASLFEKWQLLKRVLERIDPARPAFSCLCNEGELDRTSRMGTKMLIFDRYIIGEGSKPGDYDWRGWIGLLDNLRRHADQNGIPYWIVLQTCAKPGGMRFPTPAELRVMTWLSIAHNAKGVFFFLYNSMTQEEALQGLVDAQLKPVPLYDTVGALAGELRQLAPIVLNLRPADHIASTSAAVDVQTFIDGKGVRYLFVTNLDVIRSVAFELSLAGPCPARLKDALAGNTVSVGSHGKVGLTLRPGEGRLLSVLPDSPGGY